jgi:hypothetical protein
MNSNLFHNIANVASLVLALGTVTLLWSGCTATIEGSFNCSKSFIDPAYTTGAIAILQTLKMGVNVVRDGWSGLTKPQPPVQDS